MTVLNRQCSLFEVYTIPLYPYYVRIARTFRSHHLQCLAATVAANDALTRERNNTCATRVGSRKRFRKLIPTSLLSLYLLYESY